MINLKYAQVLIVGLAVRFAIAPFIAHPFDIYSWYTIESSAWTRGFNMSYLLTPFAPIWLWILSAMAYPYHWLASALGVTPVLVSSLPASMNPQYGIQVIPGPLFNLITKLPLIVSDTVLAITLYKLVLLWKGDSKLATSAMALFFLNPAVIWISSAWGQFDTLPTLFAVVSLYFILQGKVVLSSVSAIMGATAGLYAFAIVMPIAMYIVRKRKLKSVVSFFLPIAILLVLLLALWSTSVWAYFFSFFSPSSFKGIGFGLTYWSVSFLLPNGIGGLSIVFPVLLVVLLGLAAFAIFRSRFDDAGRDISAGAILLALAFFLSYPVISEARFVWVAAFLSAMVGTGTWGRGRYLGLSALTFLYAQKNFPYYLLPLTTFNRRLIQPLFQAVSAFGNASGGVLLPTQTGGIILAVLGTAFSIIAFSIYVELVRGKNINWNSLGRRAIHVPG